LLGQIPGGEMCSRRAACLNNAYAAPVRSTVCGAVLHPHDQRTLKNRRATDASNSENGVILTCNQSLLVNTAITCDGSVQNLGRRRARCRSIYASIRPVYQARPSVSILLSTTGRVSPAVCSVIRYMLAPDGQIRISRHAVSAKPE
jgi:hypothetical protein